MTPCARCRRLAAGRKAARTRRDRRTLREIERWLADASPAERERFDRAALRALVAAVDRGALPAGAPDHVRYPILEIKRHLDQLDRGATPPRWLAEALAP